MKYLRGYSDSLTEPVLALAASNQLGDWLAKKYPQGHLVRSDRALYDYVMALKNEHMRSSEPVSKIMFDSRLRIVSQALGTHTTASRVQGGKLKAKREIRIASLFKETPVEFLRMIVVHELAHLKEGAHNKAFYQLCEYMESRYHQYEFDLRVYLTYLEFTAQADKRL